MYIYIYIGNSSLFSLDILYIYIYTPLLLTDIPNQSATVRSN